MLGPRESDDRSEFDRVKEIGVVAMVMYKYGYGPRIGQSGGQQWPIRSHTLWCDHVIFHFADSDDANALPRAIYAHEVWQPRGETWCSTEYFRTNKRWPSSSGNRGHLNPRHGPNPWPTPRQLCVPGKRLSQASQVRRRDTLPNPIPLLYDKLARHLRHRPSLDGRNVPHDVR